MQQNIFKPKYPAKLFMGLVILIPVEAFLLWQLLSGRDSSPENIFAAGFFGLMLAITPYVFVKRIVFNTHSFSIEKYLWRTKTIKYTEVVHIGTTVIKTRNGDFGLHLMMNAKELRSLLGKFVEQDKISR